jgi:hypothetical protein
MGRSGDGFGKAKGSVDTLGDEEEDVWAGGRSFGDAIDGKWGWGGGGAGGERVLWVNKRGV